MTAFSRTLAKATETPSLSRSGTQSFAAPRAPRGQNLAAAFAGHTGAKAMAALAYEFARLIGAFHGCLRCAACRGYKPRAIAAAYKGGLPARQMQVVRHLPAFCCGLMTPLSAPSALFAIADCSPKILTDHGQWQRFARRSTNSERARNLSIGARGTPCHIPAQKCHSRNVSPETLSGNALMTYITGRDLTCCPARRIIAPLHCSARQRI